MYEDLVVYVASGLVGALVVVASILLSRYRQLSGRISESTEVGRTLWSALDSRLKKQDERILDIMTKFDVYESRVGLSSPLKERLFGAETETSIVQRKALRDLPIVQPTRAQLLPQSWLEPTERVVLQLLLEQPRTSVEIKSLTNKSREHAARLMKGLFERNLVARDDSKKPFVYQITERGRRYLSES